MAGGACFMRATVKQIGHISEWRPQRATGGGGEVEDGDRRRVLGSGWQQGVKLRVRRRFWCNFNLMMTLIDRR